MKKRMAKRAISVILAMILTVSQFAGTGMTAVLAEEQTNEGTWSATEYVTNGDFSSWNAEEWTISFASSENWSAATVKQGTGSNNSTAILNINNGCSTENAFSMTRTLSNVAAGTYRLSFEQEGAAMSSGLSVSIANTSLVLPATTGWDAWSTVTTDAFILTEASDVTITISGDVPAGYWGDFDNIVLEQYTENTADDKDDDTTDSEGDDDTDVAKEYAIKVEVDKTEVKAGDTVTLKATVTYGDEVVTELPEDVSLWWWTDEWNDHADGKHATPADNSGKVLETTMTLSEAGTYYIVGKMEQGSTALTQNFVTVVATAASEDDSTEEKVSYSIDVVADKESVKAGETVTLTATVKKNDEVVTDLEAEGIALWFWYDVWSEGTTDGWEDVVLEKDSEGHSFVAKATVPSVGNYYIAASIEDASKTMLAKDIATIKATDPKAFTAENDDYSVTVTVDDIEPENGDTIAMSAKVVAADGTEITELSDDLKLYWWTDIWMSGHDNGLNDVVYEKDETGNSFSAKATLPSVGTYYIVAQLEYNGIKLPVVIPMTTTEKVEEDDTNSYITGEINVEKIKDLPEDFIMGMDISSVMSEFASGVTYKDFEGNTIDNITDFCKFLAANGITHIRVRVWNDPFDANGNGYGGGNCDVATAAKIAEGCREAGLKMLIDFHCSDLWADPGKQQAPKAWADYTLEQKATAVETFIGEALNTIDPQKQTVAMVQVGNETTGSFVGVSGSENMCTLFSAGAKAVHEYNEDAKVVIHVTNPEKGNVTSWAKRLDDNNVDYDILATSYYPYWHGTLDRLESELKTVKETYGKDVMVAETSYAYTLEDTDGHANTVRVGNNDSGDTILQPFTVQGQANAIRNVMNTVNNAGGLGVFYWESAWITVGDITGLEGEALDAQIAENKATWEKHGSGWASSFASEYDAKDAGQWYGGSAVDNEAMFYPDGTPTAGLYVWNYVKTGAVSKYTVVESIENPETEVEANATLTLPETVTVTYNSGAVEEAVVWNEAEVAAVDTTVAGTYKVSGTVTFSKEINQGTYNGCATADVTCTVTVKAPNLLDTTDAGFESKKNFTIAGNGVDLDATSDVYAGKKAMHWWNTSATTGTVTYNKETVLEPGKYTAEVMSQGYAGDAVSLQILDTDEEVLFEGDATTLEGWAVWKTVAVDFEVSEETAVKLRVVVNMQASGWGTADALYLYKTGDVEVEEPEVTPSTPSTPVTPDSSDNNWSYDVTEEVTDTTTVQEVTNGFVSQNASIEEVLETIEEVVEETENTEAIVEEIVVPDNTEEKEILEEAVPLAANAGGNVAIWAVLLATLVFATFTGVYVYAKQRKLIK